MDRERIKIGVNKIRRGENTRIIKEYKYNIRILNIIVISISIFYAYIIFD